MNTERKSVDVLLVLDRIIFSMGNGTAYLGDTNREGEKRAIAGEYEDATAGLAIALARVGGSA